MLSKILGKEIREDIRKGDVFSSIFDDTVRHCYRPIEGPIKFQWPSKSHFENIEDPRRIRDGPRVVNNGTIRHTELSCLFQITFLNTHF